MNFFRCLLVCTVLAVAGCAARGPMLAEVVGSAAAQRVELTDVPFFPQEDYQCGPAALAAVLQHAGVEVTPQELTPKVYLPDRRGSLQAELVGAARTYERLPYVLAPTWQDVLAQLAAGRPVLVLQNVGLKSLPSWHFAVLAGYDVERNTVLLRSGTTERLVLDADRFMRTWDRAQRWAMVVLEPGEVPANPDIDRFMTAAAALEAVGKLRPAARAYHAAQMQWPESPWPWLGAANIDYANGHLRAAEQGYIAALERDPTNGAARNNLAEVLAQRGCTAAARAQIAIAGQLVQGTALEGAVAETARKLDRAGEQDAALGDCPQAR